MDQTGRDVIFQISGVACFCTPKHFLSYYPTNVFHEWGILKQVCMEERWGVTRLPITNVSSAFCDSFPHRLILARCYHSEITSLCSRCFSNSVGKKDEPCKV